MCRARARARTRTRAVAQSHLYCEQINHLK